MIYSVFIILQFQLIFNFHYDVFFGPCLISKFICFYDFRIGEDFSHKTIRGPTVKEKGDKFNYIKVKNCLSKDTVKIILKRLQIENREQISTKMSQKHFTKGNEMAHMPVERYSLVTMGI